MRILTGGFALWMGGWTGQVHHRRDVISHRCGLLRPADVIYTYATRSAHFEQGTFILPPAMALADSLVFRDHDVTPPDEIDEDYLDEPQFETVLRYIIALGFDEQMAEETLSPYRACLLSPPQGSSPFIA